MKLNFSRFDKEHAQRPRCDACGLGKLVCICKDIEPIITKHRFLLILNVQEKYKQSNTGIFAHLCVSNSAVKVRGERDKPLDMESLVDPEYESMLLFPKEG